ncbi:rhodanese-like domain-containing protein [Aerococcus sp. 1KP-2016]|uniref:rhodanese-like domain-containing protein n=1 Tax=Aerococcus sp. 1KP-2016 TaxID=1981982 RepID=UPI001F1AE8CC|nr:rhodanese-like domain-containing protein [Aerococcus sp. 1KP-2016]
MTTTLNKIVYENLQDEVVVDIRDNTTFRQGHLPNSLNVTTKQKNKYWDGLVKNKENIVILTDKEESLADFEDLDPNVVADCDGFGVL